MLGIVEQNLLISGMVFLATLIAMSSGYALLRKNLNVAGQAMRAYHTPRGRARPTKDLDDEGPDAAELHPHPIWITSYDRHVTWGNKALKAAKQISLPPANIGSQLGKPMGGYKRTAARGRSVGTTSPPNSKTIKPSGSPAR